MEEPPGPVTRIDGRRCVYFGGTGYLGLQSHPEVVAEAMQAARTHGIHTATSRSRFASPPLVELERTAASYFDTDDALTLPSGYLGPQALLQTLTDAFDVALVDGDAHYSSYDAARASGKRVLTFRSRDPDDLSARLRRDLVPNERPLLLTDGVLASFGYVAPLLEFRRALTAFSPASLVVDDAHGFGTIG
jgi:7-keto-8-aminopelargonate synthetase-like enzyme